MGVKDHSLIEEYSYLPIFRDQSEVQLKMEGPIVELKAIPGLSVGAGPSSFSPSEVIYTADNSLPNCSQNVEVIEPMDIAEEANGRSGVKIVAIMAALCVCRSRFTLILTEA